MGNENDPGRPDGNLPQSIPAFIKQGTFTGNISACLNGFLLSQRASFSHRALFSNNQTKRSR